MTARPGYVFDSFALMAQLQGEPGADAVDDLLPGLSQGELGVAMATVNFGEVVYLTDRRHGGERARQVVARIQEYGIDIVDVDRELALAAASTKASYRMGYLDCFVVALAQRLGATVVTGDPDFQQVADLVNIQWLPQR